MPFTLYTNVEYYMHFIYGFCNENATVQLQTIKGGSQTRYFLINKLTWKFTDMQETGTFHSTFSSICPHREDENIVAMVECKVHKGNSRIPSKSGMHCMSVWQTFNFK
jgi:hypothetical protein